jgi:hypothetical protein
MTIGARLAPDLTAHVDAVGTGQHQVEQHQVGPEVAEDVQRLVPVGHEVGLESLTAEHDAEHLRERRVVIDDQHTSFHAPHRSMCLAPKRAPTTTESKNPPLNPRSHAQVRPFYQVRSS